MDNKNLAAFGYATEAVDWSEGIDAVGGVVKQIASKLPWTSAGGDVVEAGTAPGKWIYKWIKKNNFTSVPILLRWNKDGSAAFDAAKDVFQVTHAWQDLTLDSGRSLGHPRALFKLRKKETPSVPDNTTVQRKAQLLKVHQAKDFADMNGLTTPMWALEVL